MYAFSVAAALEHVKLDMHVSGRPGLRLASAAHVRAAAALLDDEGRCMAVLRLACRLMHTHEGLHYALACRRPPPPMPITANAPHCLLLRTAATAPAHFLRSSRPCALPAHPPPCPIPLVCVLQEPPESVTMIQPPADHRLGKAHLVGGCSWGCIAAVSRAAPRLAACHCVTRSCSASPPDALPPPPLPLAADALHLGLHLQCPQRHQGVGVGQAQLHRAGARTHGEAGGEGGRQAGRQGPACGRGAGRLCGCTPLCRARAANRLAVCRLRPSTDQRLLRCVTLRCLARRRCPRSSCRRRLRRGGSCRTGSRSRKICTTSSCWWVHAPHALVCVHPPMLAAGLCCLASSLSSFG